LSKSIVVIFCSNNFHTIFDGVDLTHHKSLYDRFLKIQFEECNHSEIINYILHYNEKFVGSKYHRLENRNDLSLLLKSDIRVTHRILHQISIESQYNAIKMIHSLNNYQVDGLETMMKRKSPLDSPRHSPRHSPKHINTIVPSNTEIITKSEKNSNDKEDVLNVDESSDEESDCSNSDEKNSNDKEDMLNVDESSDEGSDCSNSDEKNSNYKEDALNVDEEPSEQEKKWNKYVSNVKPLNAVDKKMVFIKMHQLLGEIETAKDVFDKSQIVIRLFDVLATEGLPVIVGSSLFKNTIIDKINNFYETNPELFPEFKEETKDFIYAISGILC